jgi:hypothetical protein
VPAATLASSWLAHLQGDHSNGADLLPPPGIENVIGALSSPAPTQSEIADALVILAWERVASSWDLTCTIDDVDALWDILESTGTPPASRAQARHWITDAWVDAIAAQRGAPGIEPLSGLHTANYLLGRIRELDRLAADAAAHLVVLVTTWQEPANPWTRISCVLQVASALRENVRPEATLSQFGTHRALALVPDDNRARLERGRLLKTLESGDLGVMRVDVELVPLPEDRSRVTELIVRLRDGSMVGDKSGPIGRYQPGANSLD